MNGLGGALFYALAAGNALFGVHGGQVVLQGHSALLALLDADAAADAAGYTDLLISTSSRSVTAISA